MVPVILFEVGSSSIIMLQCTNNKRRKKIPVHDDQLCTSITPIKYTSINSNHLPPLHISIYMYMYIPTPNSPYMVVKSHLGFFCPHNMHWCHPIKSMHSRWRHFLRDAGTRLYAWRRLVWFTNLFVCNQYVHNIPGHSQPGHNRILLSVIYW